MMSIVMLIAVLVVALVAVVALIRRYEASERVRREKRVEEERESFLQRLTGVGSGKGWEPAPGDEVMVSVPHHGLVEGVVVGPTRRDRRTNRFKVEVTDPIANRRRSAWFAYASPNAGMHLRPRHRWMAA